jgi:hypothetical protein
METLIVEPLSRTAISTAFPLVHLVMPRLDLQAWRRFAHSALDGRRGEMAGILTAKWITRQHLSGMVCYRREPDLLQGQIMQIRNLIAIDILETQPIILALMRFLGSLARAGGCSKLNILVPEDDFSLLMLPGLITSLYHPATINHCLDIHFSAENLALMEDSITHSGDRDFRPQ